LDFHDPSSIDKALKAFSRSIQFKPGPEGGLLASATRRVTFSDVVPVARLVEKSALRYRLKGTNYIFELARYDEYRRMQLPASQDPQFHGPLMNRMTEKPTTSWGASIFDLQWDNMLGQHANFGVGHAAGWNPSLNTFFPCRNDPNPADVRAGFYQFMGLVDQVADLLSPEFKKGVRQDIHKDGVAFQAD
jgi:hypothetical protein